MGFDYGQRHRVELDCRARLPGMGWPGRLGDDHLLRVDVLGQLGANAMTDDVAIALQADVRPNTFVPGRNLLFFTLAAALAYRHGFQILVGGMSQTDYSGYPDCRDNALRALQLALSLGTTVAAHARLANCARTAGGGSRWQGAVIDGKARSLANLTGLPRSAAHSRKLHERPQSQRHHGKGRHAGGPDQHQPAKAPRPGCLLWGVSGIHQW